MDEVQLEGKTCRTSLGLHTVPPTPDQTVPASPERVDGMPVQRKQQLQLFILLNPCSFPLTLNILSILFVFISLENNP